ncbi:MAG: ribose 5-phosphate isomerase A [Treponema sp.]|nr:MAG: ribose 5-phosphate isomerase A [Treponema sp.]
MNKVLDDLAVKELAGNFAIDYLVKEKILQSGMKVGLGTGSTAMPAIKRIAEYIRKNKLKNIVAVPTSFQTSIACEELNIPVYSLSSGIIDGELDLAIDGADEVDNKKYLIKGGGAALLKEKIIAYNSKKYFIVVGENKKVHSLGKHFPLPLEIVPEARLSVMKALEQYGVSSILRNGVRKMGPVITDNGNFIIDITFPDSKIKPEKFECEINAIPGVVENGFFTKNIPTVFVAKTNGEVEIL